MIEVRQLSKSYGAIEALREVEFSIRAGEIVGLLGPNGAGKTTMMKILTGYLHPDEGEAIVHGIDVLTAPLEVQAHIGYLPESAPLYPELSVQSYLQLMAELRRIPEADRMDRMADAVYSTGLEGHLARPIGELSKGLRQRVGLAQAILHKPQILILDEPTIGLDPTQVVEVRHLIRRLALESTVLFSTHILSEVEALCDRVIILINGRVKADAKLSELASASDAILVLDEERSGLEEQLMGLDQVRAVESGNTPAGHPYYRVIGTTPGAGEALCPQIYRIAVEQSWPVRELKQDERTLEAIFNQLATSR